MLDGTLKKQVLGIPMGDPVSPGMAIGTCAYMEKHFLESLDDNTKQLFRATRYMDDILLFTSKSDKWTQEAFIQHFETNCYWQPLKLEKGKDNVFLETQFSSKGDTFRLKNVNETQNNVWRYHHYHSGLDYISKRSTLLATLKKVHLHASDNKELYISAKAKLKEFQNLQYPVGVRKYMCAILARDTSNLTWRRLRRHQGE